MHALASGLVAAYSLVAACLGLYAVHRLILLGILWRRPATPPSAGAEPHARVTVQLPVFNEPAVVERLIDAVAALQWPREQLEVQVLDDSTDATTALAERAVARWRSRGLNIVLLHRPDRVGFKAGALAAGLLRATGEYIAIFDADFLPPPDFLVRAMGGFGPGVGMVQTRWGHLNREESWLTRAQALLLDGHFVIEHTARHRGGLWFNFNGTAGIWRKAAIVAAGGWQHDTLTEDLDLSYRAQLAGWRFVYLPDVVVPAELPSDLAALSAQQHRWAKGSIQTAKKLLKPLWTSGAPWRVRAEASCHLLANLSYPVALLLLLLTPLTLPAREILGVSRAIFDVGFVVVSLGSATLFYAASQLADGPGGWRRWAAIPLALAVGVGLAPGQTLAVWEAIRGQASPFVRTPKLGFQGVRPARLRRGGAGVGVVEAGLALYQAAGIGWAVGSGVVSSLPLQALMLAGLTAFALGGSPGAGPRRSSRAGRRPQIALRERSWGSRSKG